MRLPSETHHIIPDYSYLNTRVLALSDSLKELKVDLNNESLLGSKFEVTPEFVMITICLYLEASFDVPQKREASITN